MSDLVTIEGQIVLDLDQLAIAIREQHEACEATMTAGLHHAIRAGEFLEDAKAQVRHGEWLPWLEANFDGTRKTAAAYMRLATNVTRVSHLDSVRAAIAEIAKPREEESEPEPALAARTQKWTPTVPRRSVREEAPPHLLEQAGGMTTGEEPCRVRHATRRIGRVASRRTGCALVSTQREECT